MTIDDRDPFGRTLRELAVANRLRLSPGALKDLGDVYFEALASSSLEAVMTAARICRDTLKKFPSIVEWLDALQKVPAAAGSSDQRWMSDLEAGEFVEAERLHYEDAPCACLDCQAAGITDRPVRFVPQFTYDDREERVFNPRVNRVVTAGHWAHGAELARWYRARDAFFGLAHKAPRVFVAALATIGAGREPGEEG